MTSAVLVLALTPIVQVWLAGDAAAQFWSDDDDWDTIVERATEEGQIVISGPVGDRWRRVLTSFEKDFPGIQVEYVPANRRDFWPRLMQERKDDQYLWDLRVAAPDSVAYRLLNKGGMIDRVRDLLVLPEVLSDESWIGGFDSIFTDDDRRYMIAFGLVALPVAWVNRGVVPEHELASLRDLRNPKWKRRISFQDLRHGSTIVNLAVLLRQGGYGERFVRSLLFAQDPAFLGNARSQVEALVSGKYPIAVGIVPGELFRLHRRGRARNVVPLPGIRKYGNGEGGLIAIKDPPHPYAAKLYANWLLTRAVQARIAKALHSNSRRADVPIVDPRTAVDRARFRRYVSSQNEGMMPYYRKVVRLTAEIGK